MDNLLLIILLLSVVLFFGLIFLILFIFMTVDSDFSLIWSRIFGKRLTSLRGKVVWVSGASTGLGEAIAIQLAQVGCKLIISGNEDTHAAVKAKCLEAGQGKLKDDDVLALPPFDIRDTDRHEGIVRTVLSQFKKIDILINNVGRTQRANFDSIPAEIEREFMDVNVLGQVNLTKAVIKHFKEVQAGQLAVTSSICGKFSCPFSASYNGSKFALHGYYECIRNEYPYVDVSIICPGPIFTQNIGKAFLAGEFSDLKRSYDSDDKRMKVERAAFLYCLTLANKLDEVWFGLQPVFWIFYAVQYFPSTFRGLYKRFSSPEKVIAMREGRKTEEV